MSNLNIKNAVNSDYNNTTENYEITPINTDGIGAGKETEYMNPLWTTHWAYFNKHPELKSAILMKAIWIVGKGYTCDTRTKVILDHVTGMGKDTFNDILFNMVVCSRVGRDSFAQIIKDEETGTLLNVKVLDPSSIRIVLDEFGIIKRYEQVSKLPFLKKMSNKLIGTRFGVKVFQPSEIFHLSNNRLADQVHGISDIEGLEDTLKAEMESFNDTKQVVHQQARPFIIWKLKTDDSTKINAFKAKIDDSRNKGNDCYVPDDENLVSWEVVNVNPNQVVLAWRQDVKNRFYRALGLPQIIFGQGQTTESGGKVEYLAHEQVFERDQKYLEEQVWLQLGLRINLISPVSLLEALQTDESKDSQNAITLQQSDVTPRGK